MTRLDIRALSHAGLVHAVLDGDLTVDQAVAELNRRECALRQSRLARVARSFVASSARGDSSEESLAETAVRDFVRTVVFRDGRRGRR